MKNQSKKLALLFPGMGYHVDKPLLYYAGKILKKEGYEVVAVDYGKVPHEKENALKLAKKVAFPKVEAMPLEEYSDIIFASKSIGTAIAGELSHRLRDRVAVRNLFFTPIPETFPFLSEEGIAFSGTNDPFVDEKELKAVCEKGNRPLIQYTQANHSLEVDDMLNSIRNMEDVMTHCWNYIRKK